MTSQSAGGKARAKVLSRAKRVQIARRGARARWSRARALVSLSEIRELAAQISSRAAHPAKVILFGSYARREATKNSDVDLLVLEKGLTFAELLGEQSSLSRFMRQESGFRKDVDLIVVPEDHYRQWCRNWGCVEYEARRDGIRVH